MISEQLKELVLLVLAGMFWAIILGFALIGAVRKISCIVQIISSFRPSGFVVSCSFILP